MTNDNYLHDLFINDVKGSLPKKTKQCDCEEATNEDINSIVNGTFTE